jgi:inositol-hexakisphosphate/diphosphoinositol-pentakisphosphate 1-kinase
MLVLLLPQWLHAFSFADVENWPRCDVLISFFSTDFPLDKAISYVKLRNPFCINDLPPQALLWDRRLVGAVLDCLGVPTPARLEVSRDGGPKVDTELGNLMKQKLGIVLGGFQVTPEVTLREDGDAIIIDGQVLEKPFVEKPVSGEDHNVYIYFRGGGGRRLFRKVPFSLFSNFFLCTYVYNIRLGTSPAIWIPL